MIGTSVFNNIDILNKAAGAATLRAELLGNNLANVSTPEYKRKDIHFEQYLQKELDGKGDINQRAAKVNLDNLKTTVYTDREELSYRLDGNNVDSDIEEANVAENQIRYYTLFDCMKQEFGWIRAVLSRN